jgi:hypothetical protein
VLREKYGFSVVAPIRVMVPSSTAGRSTSCCVLDHRWTSSTNRTVLNRDPPRASVITLRASATPLEVADRVMSWAPTVSARRCASVVLPVPAGPHNTIDGRAPRSISFWSARPGPTRWV